MGEAFDRSGQVLGSAVGETKREVFEKLSEAHPDAAEIRIRSGAAPSASDDTMNEIQQLTGERMLAFFKSGHLPENLRRVSEPFGALACHLVHELPLNAERTVAPRKLLEAKDCAVRAMLEGA